MLHLTSAAVAYALLQYLSHGVITHMASRNTACSSLASLIEGPPRGPADPLYQTPPLGPPHQMCFCEAEKGHGYAIATIEFVGSDLYLENRRKANCSNPHTDRAICALVGVG